MMVNFKVVENEKGVHVAINPQQVLYFLEIDKGGKAYVSIVFAHEVYVVTKMIFGDVLKLLR